MLKEVGFFVIFQLFESELNAIQVYAAHDLVLSTCMDVLISFLISKLNSKPDILVG